MTITVCGSTKFKDEMMVALKELTLQGHIVLMPGVFAHKENIILSEEVKKSLDNLHFQKIDMSQAIYVVNVGGYIGFSTEREIRHAHRACKDIYYLEGVE